MSGLELNTKIKTPIKALMALIELSTSTYPTWNELNGILNGSTGGAGKNTGGDYDQETGENVGGEEGDGSSNEGGNENKDPKIYSI